MTVLWLLGSKWNSDAQLLALHSRSSHVLTSFHCALCFNLHLSYRFTRLHFLWQWITKKRKLSSVSEELFLQRWLSFLNFCDYLNLSLRLSKYYPILFSSSQQHHLQSRWSSHGLVFSNSYTFSHIEQNQDCPPSEINVLSAFFYISICENSWAVLKLKRTLSWEINHGFIIKANWLLRGSSLLIPLSFAPS